MAISYPSTFTANLCSSCGKDYLPDGYDGKHCWWCLKGCPNATKNLENSGLNAILTSMQKSFDNYPEVSVVGLYNEAVK